MTTVSHRECANRPPSDTTTSRRQVGYDVARALAVVGMVIVNFKIVMGADTAGPAWMVWMAGLLDGRAAATFVILAGVGISLLSNRARKADDQPALAACRALLLKRSAFLFCFGLIYVSVWPADILHFYGIYLLVGTLMLTASDRQLWAAALGSSLAFVVLMFIWDYEKGWNWDTLTYIDFWSPVGMVRHLFYNGFHPVVPWTAFLLVGIWLGRRDMTDTKIRRRILVGGLAATLGSETISHFLTRWMLNRYPLENPTDIQCLFGSMPIPPMPFYIISAGGTALAVIVLCVMLAEKLNASHWLLAPLVTTGQLALTLYVAHVAIGMGLLGAMGRLENQNLFMAVISALCFFTVSMTFAIIWRRYFRKGPMEWAMRMITG